MQWARSGVWRASDETQGALLSPPWKLSFIAVLKTEGQRGLSVWGHLQGHVVGEEKIRH